MRKSGYNKQPKTRAIIRARRDAYLTRLRKVLTDDPGFAAELQETSQATGISLPRVVIQCLKEGLAALKSDGEAYGEMLKLNKRIGKVVHERELRQDSEPSEGRETPKDQGETTGPDLVRHDDDGERSGHEAEVRESVGVALQELVSGGMLMRRPDPEQVFETSAPGQPPEDIEDLPIS